MCGGGGLQVGYCLEAADQLKAEGISAEVINLRSLKPLDRNTVLDSVRKTHRCGCPGATCCTCIGVLTRMCCAARRVLWACGGG